MIPHCSFDFLFVFQLLSHVRIFVTPWTAAHQPPLSFTISWSLPKHMPIESVMISNHLILYHPLLLLPSLFSSIRVFSNDLKSDLYIRRPQYWNFSSPLNDYSGLISFRIDWFDLLAVKGALESILKHLNSKASILQLSVFFMVQISHGYWKTLALTMQTFVDKVMSLLFNMLSRSVIAFLSRSKHLLIS